MTFQEAAHLAKEAQPKEMWLTHYSPSLIRPDDYMDKVREIFPRAKAARDGWTAETDLMRSKGDADGRKEREYRRKEGRTDGNASSGEHNGDGESYGIGEQRFPCMIQKTDTHQKMFTFLQSRVPVMRRQLQS